MQAYFHKSDVLNCDCYVADYTLKTDSRKGVVISTVPFDDIDYFHLKKKNQSQNIPYLVISFEQYPDFIKGIENCECLFYSLAKSRKTWSLFLETKYCEPSNIHGYEAKTVSQMHAVLNRLESLGLMNRNDHNVYFVYSVPGREEYEPFYAFTNSPDEILKLKEEGINLLGYNTVLIATPSYLQVSYKDV